MTRYGDKNFSENSSNCSMNEPAETAVVVYWSPSLPATNKNITVNGSQLIFKLICSNKNENI